MMCKSFVEVAHKTGHDSLLKALNSLDQQVSQFLGERFILHGARDVIVPGLQGSQQLLVSRLILYHTLVPVGDVSR